MDEVYQMLQDYKEKSQSDGTLINKRIEQNIAWLHRMIESRLKSDFYNNSAHKTRLEKAEKSIRERQSDVFSLYFELFGSI
jgi:putative protein kinase ArgK-like GTPase of G3E family